MRKKKNGKSVPKEKKEFKPIDIEALVYHASTWICWCVCAIIAVNNLWLHVEWLSGFCIGVDVCLIVMTIVVMIAGKKNFHYEMDKLTEEWLRLQEDAVRRGMEDAKKKLQSGREQDTTNDNEEA